MHSSYHSFFRERLEIDSKDLGNVASWFTSSKWKGNVYFLRQIERYFLIYDSTVLFISFGYWMSFEVVEIKSFAALLILISMDGIVISLSFCDFQHFSSKVNSFLSAFISFDSMVKVRMTEFYLKLFTVDRKEII